MRTSGNENQVIWLHPEAPAKPVPGQTCNGCGVCCSAEPCPVARLFLWQWQGACRALEWQSAQGLYRCGMVIRPAHYVFLLPLFLQARVQALVTRWIAANTVCDSVAEARPMQEHREP